MFNQVATNLLKKNIIRKNAGLDLRFLNSNYSHGYFETLLPVFKVPCVFPHCLCCALLHLMVYGMPQEQVLNLEIN